MVDESNQPGAKQLLQATSQKVLLGTLDRPDHLTDEGHLVLVGTGVKALVNGRPRQLELILGIRHNLGVALPLGSSLRSIMRCFMQVTCQVHVKLFINNTSAKSAVFLTSFSRAFILASCFFSLLLTPRSWSAWALMTLSW